MTYADFVLDGTLGANGKVLAGNGRVRADDDAVNVNNLVASATAGPLPASCRVQGGNLRLVVIVGGVRYGEGDLVGSFSAVLADAAPSKSLRCQ